jgi:hypothetical protein
MAIPERVPIAHEPGYHTDTIGTFDDGQFFGTVVATLRLDAADDDWARHKRWWAVLHRFDGAGVHTGSEIWCSGTSEDEDGSVAKARERLDGWLDALPGLAYGDIAVKLFQVTVDGEVFGLVDQTEDYDSDHAELLPNELGFNPPWDGLYDT